MPDVSEQPTSTPAHAARPLSVRVLNTHIVVTGLTDALRAGLAEMLLPFVISDDAPTAADTSTHSFAVVWNESLGLWDIACDGEPLVGLSDAATLLGYLEWQISAAGLGGVEGCGVFHAGALTRGDATVLLQGESGAGKTTLVLGLMARGWLPIADDVAVIETRALGLRVFPRCFHVEHRHGRPSEARPHLETIAAVEGHARPVLWAPEGRIPTAVITVARDPEQPSSLTPLFRAQAAGALFQSAIRSRLTGSQTADLAARVAATVRYCGHLNNSDLSQALDLIEDACKR